MLKRVFVTGGNRGIGLEVVKRFLEINYEIVVVVRDFPNFPYKDDKKVITFEYDLSDVKDLTKLAEQVGEIDTLINNAGFMQSKYTYDNYPKEAKEKIMNVHLHTPVELLLL